MRQVASQVANGAENGSTASTTSNAAKNRRPILLRQNRCQLMGLSTLIHNDETLNERYDGVFNGHTAGGLLL